MWELHEIRVGKSLLGHEQQNGSGKKFHGGVRVQVVLSMIRVLSG